MSALNNGISGLNAANSNLNVISNNIANASTIGYKAKGVQFADVYSAAGQGGGVYASKISTDHAQGAINYTTSGTDLAINGGGFFMTQDANGQSYYTRAGNFNVDQNGFIVNAQGQQLQGFAVDSNGNPINGTLNGIQIDRGDQAARATTNTSLTANLDSRAEVIDEEIAFDPKNPESYNFTTSTTVYDAQGTPKTVSAYYVKTDDNEWEVHYYEGDEALMDEPIMLEFDTDGSLLSPNPAEIDINVPGTGGGDVNFTMDISGLTQFGTNSSVSATSQDGHPPGSFNGIQIADDGSVFATYSNGETRLQGVVALATFPNDGGLVDAGNTSWTASPESGDPLIGEPGTGGAGLLMSGALEMSNVDMTSELVNMVVSQSNYQANAKSISTSNQMTQVLMNTV